MHHRKLIAFTVFICFLLSCQKTKTKTPEIQIIPIPLAQNLVTGLFILDENTSIQFDNGFEVSANFLESFIKNGSSIALNKDISSKKISFFKDSNIESSEGYKLQISPDKIEIKARTDRGAFYAVQSLRQLLPAAFENGTFEKKEVAIQCVTIEDAPRFQYRGMHLDVGRHMFSVAFIKKYIDALAMLKMNTFHWHLTEDQGWRIEIKQYPKLNKIAAYRDETLVGHYSDQPHQFDGEVYGGFYSQEQIKDIVKYAQKRHVTIIPEIEMPGHSQAAISAYPELGCTREQVKVASKWGVFEHIYCSKEETFEFLQNVLDEVMLLFPSEYIHIGGDEAPKTNWENCNDCQNRIKEEGLKDEHELQNYFITRIETYLNSKGRQIIGWDEILEGGLAPNATVMSWRGMDGAIEAAKQKHKVVMTPTSHCYFDYYQSDNENEPLAIGGFLPLKKVYDFNPIPKVLSVAESKYVLGAQGNIWTEYMATEKQVEYMAFPRILAMSEIVWSSNDQKNYSEFILRVESFHKRLDALEINYANHLYEIEGNSLSTKDEIKFELNTLIENKDIWYTLDGLEPSLKASKYTGPILISNSTIIKAAVFDSEEKLGATFVQNIKLHKGLGNQITLNVEPHKAYSGSGKNGLINGINGSDTRYGDKEWLGFWGDDVEIIIDFDKETIIRSIETRFHNGNGQWIYAPETIGLDFYNEANKKFKSELINLGTKDSILVNFQTKYEDLRAHKIKIRIPNFGIIPEGKQGSGNMTWTFIDEIIIN